MHYRAGKGKGRVVSVHNQIPWTYTVLN